MGTLEGGNYGGIRIFRQVGEREEEEREQQRIDFLKDLLNYCAYRISSSCNRFIFNNSISTCSVSIRIGQNWCYYNDLGLCRRSMTS